MVIGAITVGLWCGRVLGLGGTRGEELLTTLWLQGGRVSRVEEECGIARVPPIPFRDVTPFPRDILLPARAL